MSFFKEVMWGFRFVCKTGKENGFQTTFAAVSAMKGRLKKEIDKDVSQTQLCCSNAAWRSSSETASKTNFRCS